MKYFLDSAKLDEIKLAYNTFGIDGVTTNPRHIMLSGKPFLTAITDIANWIKEEGLEGYEKFPVSVEINPHLDDTEEMIAAAKKVSAKDIVDIYKNYGFYGKTQIICAAIRTPKQIVDCAVAGADIVTTGLAVYQDAIKHAYTRQGIETFINAWDNTVTE